MNSLPLASAELGGGLVAELWPRAPYESREGGGSGVIGFAFEAQEGEDAVASDHVRAFRRRANTVAWIPPGCPAYSASRVGGEYLVLRGFAAEAIGHPDAFGRTVSDVIDSAAVSAAQELRRGLLGTWSHVAPSAAVDVLRAALLARFQGKTGRSTGWLTPARMKTIEQVVSGRVGVRTDVADVAAELGLSVGFLVLAFRTALGTTPHRYMMERRLAYARMELTATEKGIATIASEADDTRRVQATATDLKPLAERRRCCPLGSGRTAVHHVDRTGRSRPDPAADDDVRLSLDRTIAG